MKENRKENMRAAVAGCISVDICPAFAGTGKDFGEIIKEGRITRIGGDDIFPGGSVANTGIALKKFGIDVSLLCRLGEDAMGDLLMNMLREGAGEDSVETICVSGDSYSAYSLILAPQGLDRAILQNPGANDDYDIEDIDWDKLEGCSLLHFGHPPTMKHFFINDGSQLVELFEKAHEMGMITSLDLCAVDPASDAGREDWKRILGNVLPHVDFFLPSRDELADMLGVEGYEDPRELTMELIRRSVDLGASNVVIKEGELGMSYRNIEDFSRIEAALGYASGSMKDWEGATGQVPAIPVDEEVSGLGAGDTTIAAYLAAMMRGYSFEEALYLARAEGALCVSDTSATGALLPFEEMIIPS